MLTSKQMSKISERMVSDLDEIMLNINSKITKCKFLNDLCRIKYIGNWKKYELDEKNYYI